MNEFDEHSGRMRAARNLSRNPMVAVFTCVWPGDAPKHGVWLKDFAIGPDGKTSFVGDLFDCVKWVNESKHTKSGKTWAELEWEALERRRLELIMKPMLGPGGWREAR